ncbi:hypothetical protein SteCoe_30445 [Stentor coeruleus]|uniref:Uncharacterized protein n=1 Tax=Stentor coeruleus TaxID=5963 RepID=A0A1R2B428_9CILI|nr:hypothetical protein SteCoe_30445 [Stentor coeruleus]
MSFQYKTLDLDSQYRKLLTTQRDLIQNNKYMRELEQRYHKSNAKYTKPPSAVLWQNPSNKKYLNKPRAHNWPIGSSIFTKVLKSRLDTALIHKCPTPDLKICKSSQFRPKNNFRAVSNCARIDNSSESIQINLTRNKICIRDKSRIGKNFWSNIRKKVKNISVDSVDSRIVKKTVENSLAESIENIYDDDFRDLHIVSIPRYY